MGSQIDFSCLFSAYLFPMAFQGLVEIKACVLMNRGPCQKTTTLKRTTQKITSLFDMKTEKIFRAIFEHFFTLCFVWTVSNDF